MSNKPQNIINKKTSAQPQFPMEDWEDPVFDPTLEPAPLINGLLPAIPGDSHRNIVDRDMQLRGVVLSIQLWDRSGFINDFETLTIFVNGRPIEIRTYDHTDALTDPVMVNLGPKSALQTHGIKDIQVHVVNFGANDVNYNIIRVYVDVQDPNYNNQPGLIRLEDYGSDLTPADLEGKAGLDFIIPNPADRRGGDIYKVYVGTSELPVADSVPLTGDIVGTIPTAMILARSGEIPVRYSLEDRSGNSTVLSLPAYVRVSLNDPPQFGTVSVLEEPVVDKEEARNSATVRLENLTGHLPSDILVVRWGTVEIYRQALGMGIFPMDIPAPFAAIAAGGDFYTADIKLTVERLDGSTYPGPDTQVDVDLREPGVTNPDPGPVDSNLAKPDLIGGGPLPRPLNRLSEKDRGFDATATFLLPPGLESGDFIDFVYAGNVVATYPVTGAEAPGFIVTVTVDWDDIDGTGNGTIPLFCLIRDAVNYKHSPHQDVIVEVFNLDSLADAIFSNAQPVTGQTNFSYYINCTRSPWLGVPIQVLDSGLLETDDEVMIEAVRYAYVPPTAPIGMPVGTPIESAWFTLNSSDVNLGLVVPMDLRAWFEDHTGTTGRGYVGVRWKLYRPSTGDRGVSDEVRAAWDLVGTGGGVPGSCVPGASRRNGTL